MKKKTLSFAIIFALIMLPVWLQAQTKNDPGSIVLTVLVPEGIDGFPDAAKIVLSNKLTQIAVANGVSAFEGYGRFFITAVPSIVTRDIVPGPPQQIAQNMDITFYIADYFDQKIFASTSISCKGVGTNENKAYIDAIKNVSPNSPKLNELVEKGKQKIIEYYESQCDNIIKKAKSLAGQKGFEEAIYLLTSIPEAVPDCFTKALAETQIIYQKYIDYLCEVNFAKARSAWAAEQNSDGAHKAGEFLSYIYPDAGCYGEANKLYLEIKSKVLDDWKFVMKIYQDGVDLESQRISAWRDVGIAFGENQQPETNHINWIVR
ncbi:MAG: hypothetical protein LBU83_13030 [Bacteroidales bacterium]|jgi:hypothetical protein|nr:hypothetical protein [Bacteroidales bacterium]